MLGNFTYYNPTKIYFGPQSLDNLAEALKKFGRKVVLIYGGGSIKKNGIYEKVVKILQDNGADIVEDAGVMPNPTYEKLLEGAKIAREHDADLLLAVGGGSVIDYAKAVSVSAWCDEDPWDKYFVRFEDPSCKIIPVGSVLTMVGTGSEMNGGSVITNTATDMKVGHVFGPDVYPKFSILNPEFTYTLPHKQMVAGIFDVMSHVMEQYFSGDDDSTSDYLSEGIMRSLIHASVIANKDPKNYEARSNIMWCATMALNTMLGLGKSEDWEVHMIGHAISAHTNATHGFTLASVSLPYYRFVMPAGIKKFRRFAENVWHIDGEGKSDEAVAEEGLQAMERWMRELGLPVSAADLGVTEELLKPIADSTLILKGGYKVLTHDNVIDILRTSLKYGI